MKIKYNTLIMAVSVIINIAVTSNRVIGQSQVAGPNHGVSTIVIANKYPTWCNADNILLKDGKYVSVSLNTGETSDTLEIGGFGFHIPNDAIIQGITVTIKKGAIGVGIHDNSIKLIKNGKVCGDDHAKMSNWPKAAAVFNYGNNSDTWGTTWTPVDINSDNFGVAISIANSPYMPDSVIGAIDYINITVEYRINSIIMPESSGEINTNPSSVTGSSKVSDMNIYPNPGKDDITIEFPGSENQSILMIMDINGRVLMNETLPSSNDGVVKYVKDISELPTGVYMLLVNQDGKNYTAKFIRG